MLLRRHGPGSVQRGVYWGRRPSEANLQLSDLVRHAGGDGGIRTLDRALQPYNGLANRRLQPLGHVSRSSARRDICPTHPPNASARRSSLAWCWRSDWSRGELASPATDRNKPACAPSSVDAVDVSFRPAEAKDSFHPFWRRPMIETARVSRPHALCLTKPRRAEGGALIAPKPALYASHSSPCRRMAKHKRPASNAKHEQADQARPNRRRPDLISRYAATRKLVRRPAGVPTIPGGPLAWLSFAWPARVSFCGRLLRRALLARRFLGRCPPGGGLLRGGFLHRAFARRLLGDDLAGGFLGGLLGGGLLRRLFGSSFRHVSSPSHSSARSANSRTMQMRCEGTFVLISRKRCTRAQHAPSAVTIELSRALDPLIIRRRQRSHAASTQAQRRRGMRAKPQRHSRRGPAQFLLSPYFMGVSEGRGCACKHNSSPCGMRAKVEEARSVTKKSVSNRNDARVHRNRIFLRRCYQIFVDEMLQPSTSPRESLRESGDSQRDSIRLSDTKAVL